LERQGPSSEKRKRERAFSPLHKERPTSIACWGRNFSVGGPIKGRNNLVDTGKFRCERERHSILAGKLMIIETGIGKQCLAEERVPDARDSRRGGKRAATSLWRASRRKKDTGKGGDRPKCS